MNIGVDIGGSKVLVVMGHGKGQITDERRFETPPQPQECIQKIISAIEALSANSTIGGISIAVAGASDPDKGLILNSPNLSGWENIDVLGPLKERFKAPTRLVNDAHAASIAEATMGSGKGHTHVVYITLSTGVNATLVIEGKAYTGRHGTEAGHMIIDPDGPVCGCGGQGHWEALASGKAIKKRFGQYGYELPVDSPHWDEYAQSVAIGLHNLITVFSPDIVVLGGGVSVHFPKFKPHLDRHLVRLNTLYPNPPVVAAKNIETAVGYGALILAEEIAT